MHTADDSYVACNSQTLRQLVTHKHLRLAHCLAYCPAEQRAAAAEPTLLEGFVQDKDSCE